MAFGPGRKRRKSDERVDEEPELIPFIDMLVILTCFLLMTQATLQASVIEISLPSSGVGGSAPSPQDRQLNLSLIITDKGIRVGGAGAILPIMEKKNGKYDLKRLEETLIDVKKEYKDQSEIILIVEPEVLYDDLIKIMDTCYLPDIGFTDISMSGSISR
ncbi:MAG: biopolymer transporter ExbD [bacterium]|nr:biopolymer transporter ExbD [bacterium]